MRLELEIQHERKVPMWSSMFQLICDSHAAALYVQSFLDRKKSKDFNKDLDDGSKETSQRDKAGKLMAIPVKGIAAA